MNKLDEIFKTNPDLLEEPEVKELIRFAEHRHSICFERISILQKFKDYVLEQCLHSDLILKVGKPSKEVVKSILDYIEKND
jgi:lipoate synthase